MTTFLEIAAHLVSHLFSLYLVCCDFGYFPFWFWGGICLLIALVPVHCFLISFGSPGISTCFSLFVFCIKRKKQMGQGNFVSVSTPTHWWTAKKGLLYRVTSELCTVSLFDVDTDEKFPHCPFASDFQWWCLAVQGSPPCQATHCVSWALTFAFFILSQVKFGLATGKHVNWYYLFHVGTWGFSIQRVLILEFFFSPLGLTLMAGFAFWLHQFLFIAFLFILLKHSYHTSSKTG